MRDDVGATCTEAEHHPLSVLSEKLRACTNQLDVTPLPTGWFVRDPSPVTLTIEGLAPAGLLSPILVATPEEGGSSAAPSQALSDVLSFPTWLRSGFRYLPKLSPAAPFWVYKGIGFSVPREDHAFVEGASRFYGVTLRPSRLPHSPFGALDLDIEGEEPRPLGSAYACDLIADAKRYALLHREGTLTIPKLLALFILQEEGANVLGLPTEGEARQLGVGARQRLTKPRRWGQNIRAFRNPFRIEGLMHCRQFSSLLATHSGAPAGRRYGETLLQIGSLLVGTGEDYLTFRTSR